MVVKYEKEMWVRGFEVVKVNLENSIVLYDWKKVLLSLFYKVGIKRDVEVGVSEEGKVDEKG